MPDFLTATPHSSPHLVTAQPLPAQFYELTFDGFAVLLLRTGAHTAIAVVRVTFHFDVTAPRAPRYLLFPIVFDAVKRMEALFAAGPEGDELREGLGPTVLGRIESERRQFERAHLAPFGEKRAEA